MVYSVEKFFEMKKPQAKEAVELYRKCPARLEAMSEFFKVAEVCGCVAVFVCTYLFTCVCTYVRMYIREYMHACMYVRICVLMYMLCEWRQYETVAKVCARVCVCVCVCVCMHVCSYVRTYVFVYMFMDPIQYIPVFTIVVMAMLYIHIFFSHRNLD